MYCVLWRGHLSRPVALRISRTPVSIYHVACAIVFLSFLLSLPCIPNLLFSLGSGMDSDGHQINLEFRLWALLDFGMLSHPSHSLHSLMPKAFIFILFSTFVL
ncbi:hypothetical protein BDZ97DRAFT_1803968, partial [Flammula alnicola]